MQSCLFYWNTSDIILLLKTLRQDNLIPNKSAILADKMLKNRQNMAKDENKKSAYGAEAITVLEGLEPVRKRPGMYIGTTGPDGLHHLIIEIFDNSRDEAMGGFSNDIEVVLLPGIESVSLTMAEAYPLTFTNRQKSPLLKRL